MPIYEFKHPVTGEVFEDLRPISKRKDIFVAPDGVECEYMEVASQYGFCGKGDREVFELDPDYCKKVNPKKVKYRDGHSERYDPTKHC